MHTYDSWAACMLIDVQIQVGMRSWISKIIQRVVS